jgi:hypothetical protein
MESRRDIDEFLDFQRRCDAENERWDTAVRQQLNWDKPQPVRLLATVFWLTLGAGMALIIAYLFIAAVANQAAGL